MGRQTSIRDLLFAATAALTFAPSSAGAQSGNALPRPVTGFIEDVLRVGKVPGASIAVVKDDQVVMTRGYGVRELGKPDRVDAETIFDAASLTKSFTAALVATLVDDGKMSLDDPVRRYLPSIEFPDSYLTSHVTVRDLLAHRTGLRTTDSAWYFTNLKRPQVLDLVKHLKVDAPFRTGLIYSNIGYTVAGEAAAAAAGEPYEALITRRFLLPLGMTRSTAEFEAASAMGNVASPHGSIAGVQRVIPRETTTRRSTAPAGTVQSSARDLAIWLRFQLGDGSFQGRRIISTEQMAEMHSPHIVVPTTAAFRDAAASALLRRLWSRLADIRLPWTADVVAFRRRRRPARVHGDSSRAEGGSGGARQLESHAAGHRWAHRVMHLRSLPRRDSA